MPPSPWLTGSMGVPVVVIAVSRVRLGELGPADLRILISQQVALPYVRALTVHLLLEASFYEGDLLLAAVNAPASAWALLPDLIDRLRAVITTLPKAALADLPPPVEPRSLPTSSHAQIASLT